MAVAFDAQGNAAPAAGTSFTDTSFTVGSGSNRALVVTLWFSVALGGALPASISVTWDSGGASPQTMTAISGAVLQSTSSFGAAGQMYGLVNPNSGNKTLSVSWSTTSLAPIVGYCSFTGVDQTGGTTTFKNGTHNSNTGSNASSTITITSAVGDMTLACHVNDGGVTFSSTSATQDWLAGNSGGAIEGAQNHTAGSSPSNTMTATLSSSDTFGVVGVDLAAAAAAATNAMQLMFV